MSFYRRSAKLHLIPQQRITCNRFLWNISCFSLPPRHLLFLFSVMSETEITNGRRAEPSQPPPPQSLKRTRRGKKSAKDKTQAADAEGEKKKRKKAYHNNLNIYIYKVLQQVHPELGLSKQAMNAINSFAMDCFERIATEAGRLTHYNKKTTLDARAIQAALRLCFPGELGKHAVKNTQDSVTKYEATLPKKGK